MKYTIEGFNQEFALSLRQETEVKGKKVLRKVDCTDLVILRWFVDFYPFMRKMTVDGIEYAWLTHKKLLDDIPLLDITKRAAIDRMQKLVDLEVLSYKLLKENGTFSLYGFGRKYADLVRKPERVCSQPAEGCAVEPNRGMQSTYIGVCSQPAIKDKSIIDTSIIDSSMDIREQAPAPARSDPKKTFGEYGWVKLTEAAYKKLLADIGRDELERCIRYVDESAQSTGNKNKWKDWNLVIRKCAREGWGVRYQKQRQQPPKKPTSYDAAAFDALGLELPHDIGGETNGSDGRNTGGDDRFKGGTFL